jgi:flagellar biogenesis protein FliO
MSPLASYVVQTVITLVGIILLAWLVVYAARRSGFSRAGGPLELLGRLPLDGRRAVYLVRVDKTVYVLGGSDAGLTKLGEVPSDTLAIQPEQNLVSPFQAVLRRALKKDGGLP